MKIVHIEVSGGVAEITRQSPGTRVVIFDKDNYEAGDGDRARGVYEKPERQHKVARLQNPAKPAIFTPNTERGGDVRYRLYRHEGDRFSTTPRGEKFIAIVDMDACGLGCFCGAYLAPISIRGRELLATARTIDSQSRLIPRVKS